MNIGFSTCGSWAPVQDLKEIEIEDRGNPWFDDSDIDGVAVGRVYWHTAVLVQGHGSKIVALCEACDPNPAEFADGDLLANGEPA